MARNAIAWAAIIILVGFAAVWFLLPELRSAGADVVVGNVAVPAAVLYGLWRTVKWLFPERAKLFIASLLRKLGPLPLPLKRVVVRNEVEGNLNGAFQEFGCQGSRLVPYPVSVQWVSLSGLSPDSFFDNGRIIVTLDYSENPHRNIVEGGLLYCRIGLVPETRRHLWSEFRHALDLVFVHAVLERNDLREGLLYFEQEVFGREVTKSPVVEEEYNTLHHLHEHGYFTRMLLPELRDYAGRIHAGDTRRQHRQWVENFVAFLMESAQERPSGAKWVLDHIRSRFRVSIIIVGEPEKLALEGQRPYLDRIAKCAAGGARTVFLIGSSEAIPDIAANATKLQIADSTECDSYYATLRGRVRRRWCARLEISERTATSALDRVPGIEDWPDIGGAGESGEAEGA